jgi:hypothetical protein
LLLPVPHFLLTVTLPSELWDVARSHQKQVYDLFFRTSAATMQHLARAPRFVGGQMGMKVTFRYRASDTGKLRTCTLPVEEFICRFLQHVLPKGFVKVRYYGFLSSGCRQRLTTIRQQLGSLPADQAPDPDNGTEAELQAEDHPTDDPAPNPILLCAFFSQVMQQSLISRPQGRCPP